MPGKTNGGVRDSTKTLSDGIGKLASDFASTEIPTGKLLAATAATMKAISALNETHWSEPALSDIEQTSRDVADSYRLRMQAGDEMAEQEARAAAALAAARAAM